MIDAGIIKGDMSQAIPLVVGTDTIYVHTNIKKLPDTEFIKDMYEYNEIQYTKDEYIQLMAIKLSQMESIQNTILGTTEDATLNEKEIAAQHINVASVSLMQNPAVLKAIQFNQE